MVAGHALFLNGRWQGGYAGEEPFYEEHIREGFRRFREGDYETIVLSGGRTRPHLPEVNVISEADGMLDFAGRAGLIGGDRDRVLLEGWSRDSAENLFFSLFAFYQKTGRWPERIGIVSWISKGLRFQLIACGLKLAARMNFFGSGDYPQEYLARACAAEAKFLSEMVDVSLTPPDYRVVDPLLRSELFAKKRLKRMPAPFAATPAGNREYVDALIRHYERGDGVVDQTFRKIEELRPGEIWNQVEWPWLTPAPSRATTEA